MDRRSDILQGNRALGVSGLPSTLARKTPGPVAVPTPLNPGEFTTSTELASGSTAVGGHSASGGHEALGARILRLAEVAAALHLGQNTVHGIQVVESGSHS